MGHSFEFDVRSLDVLSARCIALIDSTNQVIAHTQERVRRGVASVTRQRERGMGCGRIVLKASATVPTMVDAEVFDDAEEMEQLNQMAGFCSCCGSRDKSLVALVRFASLRVDMALCGDCYQSLSDLSLGQVV